MALTLRAEYQESIPDCPIDKVGGVLIFASSPTLITADTDEKARCIARMLRLMAFAAVGRSPVPGRSTVNLHLAGTESGSAVLLISVVISSVLFVIRSSISRATRRSQNSDPSRRCPRRENPGFQPNANGSTSETGVEPLPLGDQNVRREISSIRGDNGIEASIASLANWFNLIEIDSACVRRVQQVGKE